MVNFTMLVRNRPRLTKQAIDSLNLISNEWGDTWSHQKGKAITIFTVDDRSDKETAEYLASLPDTASRENIRNEQALGTGMLRNFAIDNSEMLRLRRLPLPFRQDVFFTPGWLDTLWSCYELAWEHGYRIIGGVNHPFHQPVSTLALGVYSVHQVHALATQSMFLRWSVYDEFGPFCETPVDRVCQSEDVALSNKITAAGYKVGVVSPAVVVSTGITNTFGEKIPGWELVKAQCPEGIICE